MVQADIAHDIKKTKEETMIEDIELKNEANNVLEENIDEQYNERMKESIKEMISTSSGEYLSSFSNPSVSHSLYVASSTSSTTLPIAPTTSSTPSTSSPITSTTSTTTPPRRRHKMVMGRGGWRRIQEQEAWRRVEEIESHSEESRNLPKEKVVRGRSSEARGRSLSLGFGESVGGVREEVRAEVEEVRERTAELRSEGRKEIMMEERKSSVNLLEFTNFFIITIGVAVFVLLSSGRT